VHSVVEADDVFSMLYSDLIGPSAEDI